MEYWQASSYKLCSAWVLFVSLDLLCGVTRGTSPEEINQHLALGGEMLARGQLQDALSHFHAAVDGDPHNYLTYFKRGTVYLALSKASLAIADFNKVLELKPDFLGARHQRAHILLKQGRLEDAKLDFYYIYSVDHNEDAYNNFVRTDSIKSEISMVESYMKKEDYVPAVDLLSNIIEVCPWSSYLRELRSQCYVALNNPMSAVMDLRSTTKLVPDNTDGYYKLSILLYQLGYAQESLKEIRECLKLDPEHKDCFPHYKKVKKIDKLLSDAHGAVESKDYTACITAANKVINTEDKVPMIKFLGHEKLCHCYLHDEQLTQSLEACNEALGISRQPDVLCDRAEAYIQSELYDQAIRDYQEVLELSEGYQRAKEGLEKVQRLQKQAEKRDYYKILGVKRTATKQEIMKAYRKAAQKWHPDNFSSNGNEDEKKLAEKKFIDIAAAKEVLTDPEKRKKFDEGEDPLDPESGQHHGFNPFQQFHQFHSGGPFTFKFHFN